MDLNLKDKVAIVGGGSKGLGRACAEALAQEGAKVTICSRTQADLEQTAEEIRQSTGSEILVHAGDLDTYDAIKDVVATTASHFGRLDILVANSARGAGVRCPTCDHRFRDRCRLCVLNSIGGRTRVRHVPSRVDVGQSRLPRLLREALCGGRSIQQHRLRQRQVLHSPIRLPGGHRPR